MFTSLTNYEAPVEAPEAGSLEGEETILLVEDHDIIRKLLAIGLQTRGYRMLLAAGGDEALEVAGQERGVIDLLVTDIVMPGMDGRELAEKLAVTRPEMRILFTSAYAYGRRGRRGKPALPGAFIGKPYLADDLARKIREVLHADAAA